MNGITVVPGPGVVIRHGNRHFTIADIRVGDHIQARGTINGTTLVATEIKVEDTGRDNDDAEEMELEGAVAGLSRRPCPVVTFPIGADEFPTSVATVFYERDCARSRTGDRRSRGRRRAAGRSSHEVEAAAGPRS